MKNNLENVLTKYGINKSQLAEKAGTSPQQILHLVNGERKLTIDWLNKLSEAIGCNPCELVGEVITPTKVKLVGYIGAKDMYYGEAEKGEWEEIKTIEGPPNATTETVAVQIKGDALYPVYRDGDFLYFDRSRQEDLESLNEKDCIIKVKGEKCYLKKIVKKDKRWFLESYGKSPTMGPVDLEWAYPVLWLRRK